MRRKFLLLIIVFALSLGFCDTVTAKEKNQNKEKAASPLTVSFDLKTERLPANYKGTDIVNLYSILAKKAPKKKGEFESTAEYKVRVETYMKNSHYLSNIYAFKISETGHHGMNQLKADYNVDLQKMIITTETYGFQTHIYENNRGSIIIRQNKGSSSSYTGSNAFGARRTVTSFENLQYGIALVNEDDFGIPNERKLIFETEMPLDKAKKLKANIGVLIIGKPYLYFADEDNNFTESKPKRLTFETERYSSATFSSPSSHHTQSRYINIEALSVWVYDIRTGEILLKKQLKANNEPQVSYTDNGNGTITDNVTGLMWQKEGDNMEREWAAAGTYCGTLNLGGHSDWRLPSKKELMSIVARNIPYPGPTINLTYFPNTYADSYWSATRGRYDIFYYDKVNFNSGYVSSGYVSSSKESYSNYVRCVRGGQ